MTFTLMEDIGEFLRWLHAGLATSGQREERNGDGVGGGGTPGYHVDWLCPEVPGHLSHGRMQQPVIPESVKEKNHFFCSLHCCRFREASVPYTLQKSMILAVIPFVRNATRRRQFRFPPIFIPIRLLNKISKKGAVG